MEPRSSSRLVKGPFDEARIRDALQELTEEIGRPASLGIVFFTPDYADRLPDLAELVRVYGRVPDVASCSGTGVIGAQEELEDSSGCSVMLLALPEAKAEVFGISSRMIEEASSPAYWRDATGIAPDADDLRGWLILANPFCFAVEPWLTQWNQAFPGRPSFGGLASGPPGRPEATAAINGQALEGAIAVAFRGRNLDVHAIVSQGCRPIGEPLTITDADRNILLGLGHRPAYEVLNEAFLTLDHKERERAKGHLFAGLALSEYVEEFKTGDFLIRNILGADPSRGAIALAAFPRVGQTLQYHLRDPQAASAELRAALEHARADIGGLQRRPFAALLCTCTGRGQALFTKPNHDAAMLAEFFPGIATAGFSANGEIGPAGRGSFVHGYSATVAVFSAR